MPKINIPDDVYQRAESLGLDVEKYLIASLRAVVARMEETMTAAPRKQDEPTAATKGRPPKAAGRVPSTYQLEKPHYERLTTFADKMGISKSDALNLILDRAVEAGLFSSVSSKDG